MPKKKRGRIYTNVFNSIFNIKHSSSYTNNHIRVLFLLKIKHETFIITTLFIFTIRKSYCCSIVAIYNVFFWKRPQFPFFFSYLNSSLCHCDKIFNFTNISNVNQEIVP